MLTWPPADSVVFAVLLLLLIAATIVVDLALGGDRDAV